MRKQFLLFAILISVIAVNAQQGSKDSLSNSYKQEFLLSPLSFIEGGFEIGYGFTTKKTNTKFIVGYYYSENAGFYKPEYNNMEGFRLEAQRLFMKPTNGGTRFYAGGYAVYKTISIDDVSRASQLRVLKGSALGIGLIIGTRTYANENFFFDLFIGGGPNISIGNANEDQVHLPIVNPYKRGITPRAGLTFGIAF